VGLLKKLNNIYDKILDILAFIASIFIIFVMVMVSVDVVLRYFFNAPILGVLEISEYMMLYIPMLGAAWLLRIHGHVNIDIVIGFLNAKNQSILNSITYTICAVTCAVITYWGGVTTWDQYQRGILDIKVIEIPKFTFLISIPIGFFLLSIEFVRSAYGFLKKSREGKIR
jgi:TRAP-type C4-dicarboxylate transport system permease small subunit